MEKFICINEYPFLGSRKGPIKEGQCIYAKKIEFDKKYLCFCFWRKKNDIYYYSCKRKFEYQGGFNLSETEFLEYFKLLALVREEQINSILE